MKRGMVRSTIALVCVLVLSILFISCSKVTVQTGKPEDGTQRNTAAPSNEPKPDGKDLQEDPYTIQFVDEGTFL